MLRFFKEWFSKKKSCKISLRILILLIVQKLCLRLYRSRNEFFFYFGNMNLLSCVLWNFLLFESSRRQRCSWSFSDISPTKFSVKITSVTSDANFIIKTLQFSDSDLKHNESKKNFLWLLDWVKSWVLLNKLPSENDPQLKINRQFLSVKIFNVPHNPPSDRFCGVYHLPKIHEQSLRLR